MRHRQLTASTLLSVKLLLSACATAPPLALPQPTQQQVSTLLHLDTRFGLSDGASLSVTSDDILALTDEMREFVEENVPAVLPPPARLRYLTDALVSPKALGLQYSPGVTSTAAEAFASREGNCLALTSLFIALAREADLNVWYNEVPAPPSWELLTESSLAVYKHINAVVELADNQEVVVDLSVDNYEYQYPAVRISETSAAAQYYSNRGVEMLNSDQLDAAYLHFRRAVQLDPQLGYAWGNLGTLLRRKGLNDEAEVAFTQALKVDHTDQTALSNLSRLYSDTGRNNQAKALEKIIKKQQLKNPFWHYGQARLAYEQGKFPRALDAILRAIRLDDEQYRFHAFAAVIYKRMGNTEKYYEYGIKAAKAKREQE